MHRDPTTNVYVDIKEASITDAGAFEGYASVFNNVDRVGDIILPGAFAKSAREVPILAHHDQRSIVGRGTVTEDSKGLLIQGQIDLDLEDGKKIYPLVKKGYLKGLSIGYRVPKGMGLWRDDNVYEIREVDLYEVSLVTIPANPKAQVARVKSMEEIAESIAQRVHFSIANSNQQELIARAIAAGLQKGQ